VFTVFEPLQLDVFDTYKECAINKASSVLRTNEKSSQTQIKVTFSTEVSSFFIIFPKHADVFAPSWHKFKNSVMIEIGY
jgi:hypothetical protein